MLNATQCSVLQFPIGDLEIVPGNFEIGLNWQAAEEDDDIPS
jgi:hypothetical protein